MADFVALQKTFADSPQSWKINVANLDPATCDLSVKNPDKQDETELRAPEEILAELAALDEGSAALMENIRELL